MELMARIAFGFVAGISIIYLLISVINQLATPRSIKTLMEKLRYYNKRHDDTLEVISESSKAKQLKFITAGMSALQWQIAEISKILFDLSKRREDSLFVQEQGVRLYEQLAALESKALRYYRILEGQRDTLPFDEVQQSFRLACLQAHSFAKDVYTAFCM